MDGEVIPNCRYSASGCCLAFAYKSDASDKSLYRDARLFYVSALWI